MRLRFDFPALVTQDDAHAGATPLEFTAPRQVLIARTPSDVLPVLRAAEAAAMAGAWVAGFLSYESAPGFDAALVTHDLDDLPLAWFAVFAGPSAPSAPTPPHAAAAGPMPTPSLWRPRLSDDDYRRGFAAVKDAIAAGDSYQANYTLRLDTTWPADDVWSRYDALVAAHRPSYAACLDLDDVALLSLSPELLLEKRGRRVLTAPMKGTARRGRWPEEDAEQARHLAASAKDRAENVMIVDLARNDLGRVAVIGSVEVLSLFTVQRYRAAWQMVSTVAATLRDGVTLTETLASLFPAGSITGAPKTSTMRLIRQIEPDPRGLYCGSIGLMPPGGDAIFNVAIRTAVVEKRSRRVTLGVGGGITWDSVPAAELAEARLKASFLDLPPAFDLLETMRFDGMAVTRWPRHLARLLASAAYFDIPVDAERITAAVIAHTAMWPGRARRLRLTVSASGEPAVTSSVLDPLGALGPLDTLGPLDPLSQAGPRLDSRRPLEPARALPPMAPVRVAVAGLPVKSDDVFLCHKTTYRAVYESRRAARTDVLDVLLRNERDELTEFTNGNLVLELDGRLVTPPRTAGLLGGVFRETLLAEGRIREQTLTPAELRRASGSWLINSVREWLPVTFVP